MSDASTSYVPCLRWKMGEYQALWRSRSAVLDRIVPLIEVAEVGFDFETRSASKSIDEHLAPLARRVHDKLGCRPCFIDMRYIGQTERMENGQHPAAYVCDGLRDAAVPAIPTFYLRQDEALFQALQDAIKRDQRGALLRIRPEEIAHRQFAQLLTGLLNRLDLSPSECDLALDLESPNFVPIEGFAGLLETLIAGLPSLAQWRSFTIIATSFPDTMAGLPRGSLVIPRHEWTLYRNLVLRLKGRGLRLPRFGDYAIAHPALVPQDPRYVKPNATVRYTVDGGWLIAKGQNVRDHKFDQYRDLCRMVVESGHFEGSGYSAGDKYIEDCAAGVAGTGNLSTWRWVGTSHHLARILEDISSLNGTSSSP